MLETEEEQQQRPFCPDAQRRRAGRCDQNQGIELETLATQIIEGFADSIETTETVGQDVAEQLQLLGQSRRQLLDGDAEYQQRPASQRDDHFGVPPNHPP